jgi:hypothetical protein
MYNLYSFSSSNTTYFDRKHASDFSGLSCSIDLASCTCAPAPATGDARGDMENQIKECQLDLYADRTSTATMRANQLRLVATACTQGKRTKHGKPRAWSAMTNRTPARDGPGAPWSRFPAPIGPKPSTMPTEHGFRFDHLQRVENVGSQRVHAGKDQPVDAGEVQTARGLSAEHIQLVPEHQDFGFQLGP